MMNNIKSQIEGVHHETQKDISSLCEEAKADINTLRGELSGNRGPTQEDPR